MARTPKAAAPAKKTIGEQIDAIWQLREDKRGLETQVKKLNEQIEPLETALIAELKELKLEAAAGAKASITTTKTVAPNVDKEKWDEVWAWIAKTKNYQLLRKQLNDAPYRELLDMGKKIPGVEPFEKTRLNLRTVS